MAKRPDFAQKLLDDIRRRKEKLGYVASSSGQQPAQPPASEYHVSSRRSSRGTGDIMKKKKNYSLQSSKNPVSAQVTEIWFSTKHNKTAAPQVASREIVPAGRATSIQNSVDVSMALALALSNSGKLHYIAKFGNELIPHSGSIYYAGTANQHLLYSTKHHADRYPFLSNLQVGEISKGVQKLNKILETFSDRTNFGKDSIQIGRELLKGAIDLEESLKMLATLQEASDYMVGSQGRQIKLLEGVEDDETSDVKDNRKALMYKPRISFDGSINHFYKFTKANDDTIIQGQRKTPSSSIKKSIAKTNYSQSSLDASTQVATHKQSLSCGPGSLPNSLYSGITHKQGHGGEPGNFSTGSGKFSASKNTKQLDPKSLVSSSVRMPNIVAKLMGLEELPMPKAEGKKVEGKKEPKSKKEMVIGQTSIADEKVRKENKILNENGVDETKDKSSKEKTNYIRNMTPLSNHAPKRHLEINRKIENIDINHSLKEGIAKKNLVQLREMAEKEEERRNISESVRQLISKSNQEGDLQRTKKKQPSISHDETAGNKDKCMNQKDNGQDCLALPSTQTNTRGSLQKATVKVKPKNEVCEIAKEKERATNIKLKATAATKSEQKSRKSTEKISMHKMLSSGTVVAIERNSEKDRNVEQPKGHAKSSHQEMQNTLERTSAYVELDRTSSHKNSEDTKLLQTYSRTDKELPQILVKTLMKPVNFPTAKKVDTANMKVQKGERHKVLGDSSGYNRTQNEKRQQSSFLHDLEKRWKERISKEKGTKVSFHETNSEQHLEQKTKSTLVSDNSSVDAGKDNEVLEEETVAETNDDDIIKSALEALPEQEASISVDSEPQPYNNREKLTEDVNNDRQLSNCNTLNQMSQAISEVNGQGSLTKDEHFLMQLLINNQHFRNTAQEIFKIDIPVGVLQTSNQACPKEENKLLLDCGYELLRRKGKREVTCAMTRPHATGEARYLDALVKELNDDLESLKFPKETTYNDDIAEFLHMMLERDIENSKPDINCLWDIGWNSSIFASVEKDEIVRDMEKHVLNGLINELARELVDATINVS
ncbi:uncharacterized protein LOC103983562 [Musa acuminata AAA Group]|uniref:uncharacterized protein LOC103983562 n=1 Tax=Musa acuminata AAA Group TaxID=214697 RepID=UPI0031E1D25B